MKSFAARIALLVSLLPALSQPVAARGPADSRREIEAVVEAFRTTIMRRDIPGFMGLFLHEHITWVGVHTDASLERHNAGRGAAGQPRPKLSSGSPRGFIDKVARGPERRIETIAGVRIDTDGEVAQVWFDYAFMLDDYRNNWGKESWQLVRTDQGWKIAAVIWSSEQNPAPRPQRPAQDPPQRPLREALSATERH